MRASEQLSPRLALGILVSLAFLLGAAAPASATWVITPTAAGCETGYDSTLAPPDYAGPISGMDALYNSCSQLDVGSGEYSHGHAGATKWMDSALTVTWRLAWTGAGQPQGVRNNTIKVLVKVEGSASVSARPYRAEPDSGGGYPPVGTCRAKARITSSIGSTPLLDVTGTDPDQGASDSAQLAESELRVLTLNGNEAETSVTLARYAWVTETNGGASSTAAIRATLSLSIVQLVDPVPGGDPVLAGQNEYVFRLAHLGPNEDVDFPYLEIPCKTAVLHGDPQELRRQGRIEWSVSRSWAAPLARTFPNELDMFGRIWPQCLDPIQSLPFFLRGLIYGREDFLPGLNSNYGPATVAISVAPDINLHGWRRTERRKVRPGKELHEECYGKGAFLNAKLRNPGLCSGGRLRGGRGAVSGARAVSRRP